jgi:hypothetical protein
VCPVTDYDDYTVVPYKEKSVGRTDTEVVVFDDCLCIAETAKAIKVILPDNDETWIPKSQVDDDSEVYEDGDSGTLVVSRWFSDKEGITNQGTIDYGD